MVQRAEWTGGPRAALRLFSLSPSDAFMAPDRQRLDSRPIRPSGSPVPGAPASPPPRVIHSLPPLQSPRCNHVYEDRHHALNILKAVKS